MDKRVRRDYTSAQTKTRNCVSFEWRQYHDLNSFFFNATFLIIRVRAALEVNFAAFSYFKAATITSKSPGALIFSLCFWLWNLALLLQTLQPIRNE